ncbi:amine oxidase [Chloroherpeton thalassium ATCC 35110]|uniref:Amine oxidase n=1 Tax=Chloroherpeton thalassium (strain ATCC 35110 / GB-78) TaxID=517418 RepID=B3QXF2_CHLT3|nr:NAD(P)/FAD-dependent oxidoreductase [Chloroherpeton thalassium]ACF13426.1 amine oxidase [Chloroherpeton thalassium ATCC 35110]
MRYDFVVIGSGIGGLSAAALLAKEGFCVLVLEANYLPGGCASSYPMKHAGQRFVFESGATTLVGFDAFQPFFELEKALGIKFPLLEINPSMTVHFDNTAVVRYKNREKWVDECYRKFFQQTACSQAQVEAFWEKVFELSDFVWRISGRNRLFPPTSFSDVMSLIKNNQIQDFPKLAFLFESTKNVLARFGLDKSLNFVRFCDEQLMITAQANSNDTPFLYAAPCLSYTCSSNFYAYGGLVKIAQTLVEYIESAGGNVRYRAEVTQVKQAKNGFELQTQKGRFFAREVISNAPIWNMAALITGKAKVYFEKLSRQNSFGWGAFTMSIALRNELPELETLHHQFILKNALPHCQSNSFFVSLSMPDDFERQPKGFRLLAISTHTFPRQWFETERYAEKKREVSAFILNYLETHLAGFKKREVFFQSAATPKTWQDWTWRKTGRVGGIPQSMSRALDGFIGAETPVKGLYLVGDTVYPGQGVAGVCLSAQNAVQRILKNNA